MRIEEITEKLARGTTCYDHVKCINIYKGYVIFHHKCHPDYVGGFTGSVTCRSYFGFFKLSKHIEDTNFTEMFLSCKEYNIRKTKKNIEYIKSIIDKK